MIWKKIFGTKSEEPTSVDWLVVGLGNPGNKYEATRHNVGWMCALEISKKYGKQMKCSSNIYYHSFFQIENQSILLAMPTTYMNKSGEAVKKLSDKYSIPCDRTIIIFDELNFPVGKLHLRQDGSDGGHNGVSSVIDELGRSDFYRLRCGIGNDFPSGGMIDYVLSPFKDEESSVVKKMIEKTPYCIELLARFGKMRAMTEINSDNISLCATNITEK